MHNMIMMYFFLLLVIFEYGHSQIEFTLNNFKIALNTKGEVVSLDDQIHNYKYLSDKITSPLLKIKCGGVTENPSHLMYDGNSFLNISYPNSGVEIKIQVFKKVDYVVFEVVDAKPLDKVDAIIWGPYATKIDKTIGEIVGVVRDDNYAIGLQVLNVKTIGGLLENEEGVDFSRSSLARKMEFGSTLQAYSINRSKERKISVWGENFPNMPIPPMQKESIIGSKIAIFGCSPNKVLELIGNLEIAEGLPHPIINGVWAKLSTEVGRSYLIANFSESDIDEMIGYTKRANLLSLYHFDAFKSWGHYEFNPIFFPSGMAGMKKCVEKAKSAGIYLGAHTLTNFINTNDPYITPIPDPRLAKTGSTILAGNIDKTVTEIPIESSEYFINEKMNNLHTVMIDQELIRYGSVSKTEPWKLLDCQRGSFGTIAADHRKNSEVAKLLDHSYNVFFPNIEMQTEIAKNLAKIFNESGLSHLDFDGHEGCWAAGQGDFGPELFAKVFYENLDHTVLNGTSMSKPFYWHINTYCNWGEPWYGGFRESMQEYRINNQSLFERNYMPNMLGWYLLTETTSLNEMEWMLARASGYNAGFAMTTSLKALRENSDSGILLDAIREWENARRSKAFLPEQREKLKDPKNEFHLEKVKEDQWDLYPFHKSKDYYHEKKILQPGEPTSSKWEFTNTNKEQFLQLRLEAVSDSGYIKNPTFRINNYIDFTLDVELKIGESLVCDGTPKIRIYDSKGRQIRTIKKEIPKIREGNNIINFDCQFSEYKTPKVLINFKTIGKSERIKAIK